MPIGNVTGGDVMGKLPPFQPVASVPITSQKVLKNRVTNKPVKCDVHYVYCEMY